MAVPVVRFPIYLVIRLVGFTVAALVLTWTLHYRGGLALISDNKDLIFNWAAGFTTFWYPGGSRNSRAFLLPWHVFFGIYIYALAIVTSVTGILEKATFLQTNHVISRYSTEAMLVNTMGLLIVALGGFVILALVAPVNGKSEIPRAAE